MWSAFAVATEEFESEPVLAAGAKAADSFGFQLIESSPTSGRFATNARTDNPAEPFSYCGCSLQGIQ